MNERYAHWWTPQMSRDFEMLIFGDGRKRCGHDWNYWRDMLPPYLSTI
jgi:esterase/lipase superfamily enzyme